MWIDYSIICRRQHLSQAVPGELPQNINAWGLFWTNTVDVPIPWTLDSSVYKNVCRLDFFYLIFIQQDCWTQILSQSVVTGWKFDIDGFVLRLSKLQRWIALSSSVNVNITSSLIWFAWKQRVGYIRVHRCSIDYSRGQTGAIRATYLLPLTDGPGHPSSLPHDHSLSQTIKQPLNCMSDVRRTRIIQRNMGIEQNLDYIDN